jgi:hypothetical protein
LRAIIKHSETLFDDKASVDVKELFLAKEQIQATLSDLKEEVEARKDEKDGEKDEAEDKDGTSPEDEDDESDSKASAVEGKETKLQTAKEEELVTAEGAKDEKVSGQEEEEEDAEESKVITQISYTELKEKVEHIQILLDFITEHFASIQGKLDRLVPKGMISFKLLWCVIKPGMIVKMNHQASGEPVSAPSNSARLKTNDTCPYCSTQ